MHTSNLCKTAEERIRAEDMKGLSMSMSTTSMSMMSMPGLGVHVIDRFTYHVLEFFEKLKPKSANNDVSH